LIAKIGLARVEWLEGPHDTMKYTVEDLQSLLKKYQSLNKEFAKQ